MRNCRRGLPVTCAQRDMTPGTPSNCRSATARRTASSPRSPPAKTACCTKDGDFVTGFLLHGTPPRLLLISTGNISNDALSHLLTANLSKLVTAFARHRFVELNASAITIHA